MFFKKSKKSNNGEAGDASNIFEEFESDTDLQKEVDTISRQKEKDWIYYIWLIWGFFQTVFFIGLFISMSLYWYIYVQTDDQLTEISTLTPICNLISWKIQPKGSYCSSISYLHADYTDRLKELEVSQVKKILEVLWWLYKIENFTKSKHVLFIENKSHNKLKVLEILEKFNTLKTSYNPIELEKIQCNNIEISNREVLSMRCESYSIWFENSGIKWFNGTDNNIWWTSISVANSFLNYIEKNWNDFTIINRQKIFSADDFFWESTGFTKKTIFNIELQYNSNILPL
jgi:hypothetical protein